ncbi:MAG: two-component system C4-dicarboxylate transport sensor histidine kinase DctB [Desulforhopalus sp.]|jgi:two-component system C4-dicarboxylate transport sensor histidine kinase DctB
MKKMLPQSRKKRIVLLTVFFSLLLALTLKLGSYWAYNRGISDLEDQGNTRLDLYVNYLQGVLEKYQSLPALLAIDSTLVRALSTPHEKKRIETLNRYLETINKVSDTLDTYLMNRDGLTIAASNWKESRPFVGRNFSYRPYFKQAMTGKLGRYFALGVTSSKRGYYFAYPVRKNDEIIGAVAIKISIDSVEQKWAQQGENFLVTDPDGVIFITTYPGWRYKTLEPLTPEALNRINESKRYPETAFDPVIDEVLDENQSFQFLTIHKKDSDETIAVVKQSRFMPQAGWNVHILTDVADIKKNVLFLNLIVASAFLVCYILTLLILQRHYRLQDLAIIEENTKAALRDANEQLETRVVARTQELTEANELLIKEVIERKETEIKLKRTRKELIHAAKLAVLGQMSAGINHELNQPLAAIRSYTDNGTQFLKKGRYQDAMWNLEQIAELTERMAQIGVQLKLFSKKSSGQIVTVPLHGVVDGAMEILNPALKKAGVVLNILIEPSNLEVRGNNVLLQQVLVNLITNAMHAMESTSTKIITLTCSVENEKVLIAVEDTGAGITDENLKNIFDPFYTTKKSGQGLGLGLTISDRIVRDFGGKIVYVPSASGARFEFRLEKIG